MAPETFLDIEGAFDNVEFHAIEKALHKKCSSSNVNKWMGVTNNSCERLVSRLHEAVGSVELVDGHWSCRSINGTGHW